LTSGPPHEVHWLGRHLKRRHGLAWLADFRDPWVTGRALGGLASKKRRTGRLSWERSVLREADAVVVNTPLVRELFREAYPEYAAKFTTVANGYDPEAFPPPAAAPTATRNGTPPVLLHAGELYLDRDPRPLFDALQTLQREGHPCRLRLLGRCNDPALDLEAEAQARGLAELELADQVPYHQALGAMAAADLLLLLDTPGRRVGVPAKLYEYLGAGRPVLALAEPDGDTARVLAESGLTHRVAPPRSAAAITQALRELLAARRASAATPDGSLGRLQFTREHQAGRLASLLDQTRGSGRRRSQ
jgi:glycosyltransferase involved in cell wall biosynthesis